MRGVRPTAVLLLLAAVLCVPQPAVGEPAGGVRDLDAHLDGPSGTVTVPSGVYDATTDDRQRVRPLVLVADGPVVIDGGLYLMGASNLTFRGPFLVRGSVQIRGSTDITLDGVEVTNPGLSGGTGIVVNRQRGEAEPSRRITLRDVYVHDTYDDAIRVGSVDTLLVEGVVAERVFDVPQATCDGEKCHDDAVQVMGPSTGVVLRDNDFAATLMLKTDLGDIDIELDGNRVHDDHNVGIHLHEVDGTDLQVRMTGTNWVWNHPHGTHRITGTPEVTGIESLVAAPPPPDAPSRPRPVPVDAAAASAGGGMDVPDDDGGLSPLWAALAALVVASLLVGAAAGALRIVDRRRVAVGRVGAD